MIGILLLMLSIYFYVNKRYRDYSIFFYLGFLLGSLGGYNILTDEILGFKNIDNALIFTFFVIFYKWNRLKNNGIGKVGVFCVCFSLFIFCSFIFSILYYKIPWEIDLRDSRSYYLVYSYFVFKTLTDKEFKQTINLVFRISYITSIIFILQIVIGTPLMPYPWEYKYEGNFNLIRLYNYPSLLIFFLIASFSNGVITHNKQKYRIVFFLCMCATMGRTFIALGILALLLLYSFEKKENSKSLSILFLLVFLLPFYPIFVDRFQAGGTSDDLDNLIRGDFRYWNEGVQGTMTFRIAWLYERWEYIIGRPISEIIFGLGFIGDGEDRVQIMYNFNVGLKNIRGEVTQLSTPDIMFGDVLTHLGVGGGIFYLSFIGFLLFYLWKGRNLNIWSRIGFISLLIGVLESFSSATLAEPKNCSIYYFLIAWNELSNKKLQSNSNNSLL